VEQAEQWAHSYIGFYFATLLIVLIFRSPICPKMNLKSLLFTQRFGEFDCTEVKENMARLCDSVDDEKTVLSPLPPMIYDGTNALEEEEEVGHSSSAVIDDNGGKVLGIAFAVYVIMLL